MTGREAYRYYEARMAAYLGVPAHEASAQTIAKLFFTPAKEAAIQTARPLDPERREWLDEWARERAESLDRGELRD